MLRRFETLASRPAFAWAVAILLGFVNMVPSRFILNPDGITYMNLATLYQHGEWGQAINGYWSPLYPILIAATFRIVNPSAYFESTTVHALTFVIYLGAFAAFRFFLKELRALQSADAVPDDKSFLLSFRSLTETACAYTLFFWGAISLIGFPPVTPDMTLALLVFVASGLTVRLKRKGSVKGYLGLGATIGLAYLTKSVMFPLGLVACLVCAVPGSLSAASRRSALTLAGFLLIASPQLVAMSRLSGHLSYSSTGKVAYAREVNQVPLFWIGLPAGSGTPVHGMRVLSQNPPAFDASLPNTTFSDPVSDKLAYWFEGIQTHVSIWQQLGITKRIVWWYADLFEALILASLILYLLRSRITPRYVALILPSLAAFAIYALVFAEARYLGAWVVILFLCFAASITFDNAARRGVNAVMAAVAIFCAVSVLNLTRSEVMNTIDLAQQAFPNSEYQTAVEAQKLGLQKGSRIGSIGNGFSYYWARLAGVQVAMQVPDSAAYSAAPDSVRARVLESFRRTGAVAVVSFGKPAAGVQENWQQLGPAGYWIFTFPSRTQGPRTEKP